MDQIPKSWQTSLVVALSRVLVIAFWVIVTVTVLRLMAWADTGSRGECPVEKNLIPTLSQPKP